ncbi:MAG: LysR family transcriptional regulator [Candidatus Thiodiazotropha sp. (ex Monitilora ramsayi)]|nr:LysR family transcriptional regulator [Candidatus Thiodiazotropha sp. (ex Monitilora ramsayi)]
MSVLPYIEIFAAVVEKGSFTAAADALGISKPVVSKQISQLEKQLGVQLLHRTTRRLHLTEAGEIFALYAKNIVADSIEAEQSVLPLQNEPAGKLRITAPESLAITLLQDALFDFQHKYPKIELDLHISGSFMDLIEEGFDIALRLGNMEDSSLIARRLMPCNLHICASPNYWKIKGKPLHPNDLKKQNCLVYSPVMKSDTWVFKGENGEDLKVKVKGNLRSGAGTIILQAGLRGQGVFIAPTYMVEQALQDGELEEVLSDYSISTTGLFAVYPYSKMVSRKVRVFIDFLKDIWNPK